MEGFRGVGISNHGKLAETNAWDRRSKEPRNHVVLSGSDGSSGTSWWRGQQNVPLLWPPRCVESRCFPPPWGLPTTWKNGQVELWVVLGVFSGNVKTKTHERTG